MIVMIRGTSRDTAAANLIMTDDSSLSSSSSSIVLPAFIVGVLVSSLGYYVMSSNNSNNNDNYIKNHKNDDKNITKLNTTTTVTTNNNNINSNDNDNDNKIDGIPQYVKDEIFSRIQSFFGASNFDKVKKSYVIVVGLGGVGSHAAHMLVRSGVGNLRLIDFDQVTVSSLNRHAVASMEDVGISKVEAMKRKLLKIVPWCNIEAINEMFRGCDASQLLSGQPDFVIDAIDDVNTKAELIAYCVHNKIKVLTSMGAGAKADPTRLRIATLSECIHDPLASKIKWKLKKHGVQADDVMSIFSLEMPIVDLQPLDDEQKNAPQDFGAVDYLRLRIMPVLGTSPSIFGQAMASYILCSLANKLYEPEVCERMSKNLKHKLRQTLKNFEFRRGYSADDLDIDEDDIEFVVQQVWHSRCAITGRKFGGHAPLVLIRWDKDQIPSPSNLVLLMQPYAELITKGDFTFLKDDDNDRINMRLKWAQSQSVGYWETPSLLPGKVEQYNNESGINNDSNRKYDNKNNNNNNNKNKIIISSISFSLVFGLGYLIGKVNI